MGRQTLYLLVYGIEQDGEAQEIFTSNKKAGKRAARILTKWRESGGEQTGSVRQGRAIVTFPDDPRARFVNIIKIDDPTTISRLTRYE